MSKYYKIPEDKLLELLIAEAKYQALENGGVDNWEWYTESYKAFLESCAIESDLPRDINFDELAEYDITAFEVIK